MNNAVPYFLNIFNSSASDNCKLYFNFNEENTYVKNVTGQSGYLNGEILPSVYNFWQNSGSGMFSGNYVKIPTTGDINLANATYSLVYEKVSDGGATLISTIETGSNGLGLYYKGFEFGVTANNYLYFEYFTNNGPQVFNSNISLSDKSSVFLSIENGAVSFGNYDFFRSRLNSVSFPIDNTYLFNPKDIYLGYNNSIASGYNYNKQFTGYIDNFLMFSPSIYTYDIRYLNSGFAYDYQAPVSYVTYYNITGITGYITGVTGYYTYVTGQQLVPTGISVNCFGMQYTGYDVVDLTATLSGSGVIPLTGITAIPTTGFSGEGITLNKEYIYSFGKQNINILRSVVDNDLVDVNLPSYDYPYNAFNNLSATYDASNGSFYNIDLNENDGYNFIVFTNGLAQNSGAYVVTGSVYDQQLLISNDYIVGQDKEIIFNNNFNQTDDVYIDKVTGQYNSGFYIENFAFTGNINTIQTNWKENYNVFYNGQKLTSGNDSQIGNNAQYGINSTGIYIKNTMLFSGQTGQLFALPKNYSLDITGNKAFIKLNTKFFNNYSEVYLNGVRQVLNNDYIELASIDLNTGSGIFDIKRGILYNNNYI